MTNQQCRLIASAIVLLAGGLTLSLGLIAKAGNHFEASGEVAGVIILLAGTIIFLVEYIKSHTS